MIVRSTLGKHFILSGFVLALLVFFGHTAAAPPNSAGIISDSLNTVIGQAISSPYNPRHNEDVSGRLIDNENDDDPQGKFTPDHAVDNFLFERFAAANRDDHPLPLQAATGITHRPAAIYMLTGRFRL